MHALEILHSPWTFIGTLGCFFSDILQSSRTWTTFLHMSGIFYFGHLAAKLFVHIPQMLWKFCIFPEYLCEHQACFLSDIPCISKTCITFVHLGCIFPFQIFRNSACPWDMSYICTCEWHVPFQTFSFRIICAKFINFIFSRNIYKHQGCFFRYSNLPQVFPHVNP